MSKIVFAPATRDRAKLKLVIQGPPGAGKTYTALELATYLIGDAEPETAIAVLDSERGRASKYAGGKPFSFSSVEFDTYEMELYEQAIKDAVEAGFQVLIIDSLSHVWNGTGGALEFHDHIARTRRKGDSFAAWQDVNPVFNSMMGTLLGADIHIIATMRTKTEYVINYEDNKNRIRQVGLKPVMRDTVGYEFDFVFEMDGDHAAYVSKTSCVELEDAHIHKPGQETAELFLAWLGDGETPKPKREAPKLERKATSERQRNGEQKRAGSTSEKPRLERDEPLTLDAIRTGVGKLVHQAAQQLGKNFSAEPTVKHKQRLAILFGDICDALIEDEHEGAPDDFTQFRHTVVNAIFPGKDGISKLNRAQGLALGWLMTDEGNLHAQVVEEFGNIYVAETAEPSKPKARKKRKPRVSKKPVARQRKKKVEPEPDPEPEEDEPEDDTVCWDADEVIDFLGEADIEVDSPRGKGDADILADLRFIMQDAINASDPGQIAENQWRETLADALQFMFGVRSIGDMNNKQTALLEGVTEAHDLENTSIAIYGATLINCASALDK